MLQHRQYLDCSDGMVDIYQAAIIPSKQHNFVINGWMINYKEKRAEHQILQTSFINRELVPCG